MKVLQWFSIGLGYHLLTHCLQLQTRNTQQTAEIERLGSCLQLSEQTWSGIQN